MWGAGFTYFNIGFGFAANIVLVRLLAPEHFGVVALGSFFFSLVSLRSKIGIGAWLGRQKETSGAAVGSFATIDLGLATATVAVCAAIIPLLLRLGYSADVVWASLVLAGIGMSDSLAAVPTLLLEKSFKIRPLSLLGAIAFPISYAPGFWLATHGGGYWSLLAQTGTVSFLQLLGKWLIYRREMPQLLPRTWSVDRKVIGSALRFGGIVGLVATAEVLVGQFDNLLVGTLLGLTVLGFYDRAYRTAQWVIVLFVNIISKMSFYTFSSLQDDPPRLLKAVTMTNWLANTLSFPVGLAVAVAAPELVVVLYGPTWEPCAVYLRLLVVWYLMRPFLDLAASLFVAVGKPQRSAVVVGAEAAAMLTITTGLTLAFGALGTAVGVGVAYLTGCVLSWVYVRKVVPLRFSETLAPHLVAAAITAGLASVVVWVLSGHDVPTVVRLLVELAFTGTAFFLVAFAIQPRRFAQRLRYSWSLIRAS